MPHKKTAFLLIFLEKQRLVPYLQTLVFLSLLVIFLLGYLSIKWTSLIIKATYAITAGGLTFTCPKIY